MDLRFVNVEIYSRDNLELMTALDNEGYSFNRAPKMPAGLPEGRPVEVKADYIAGGHPIETWINMENVGGHTSYAEIDISVLIDKRKKEWRNTTITYNSEKDSQTAVFEKAENSINRLKKELSLKKVEILSDDEWDSIVTEAINFVEKCMEEGFAKVLPDVEDFFGVHI